MESGAEPDPAALERVRRDLARLGSDASTAPDVPPAVTARVVAALRTQPAHSIARPRIGRLQAIGLIIGVGAALAGVIVGASMLKNDPQPSWSRGPTAKQITVPRRDIPLSDPQIVGLLSRSPEFGPLADPQRRASCLDGLGYPGTTPVLGAQPVDMYGRPGLLMLLGGDTPDVVVAVVVEPNCSAAHPGRLADTVLTRP